MKKIFLIFGILTFIFLGLFILINYLSKKNNEKQAEFGNEQNSQNLTGEDPELLTFLFSHP